MAVRAPIGYSKRNCTWPVQRLSKAWEQADLAVRYMNAVMHLMSTPRGALYYAPDYGTTIHTLRAQSFNIHSIELSMVKSDTASAFERYLPDLELHNFDININGEEEKTSFGVIWTIKGANGQHHGKLGDMQTTTVSL